MFVLRCKFEVLDFYLLYVFEIKFMHNEHH